MGLKLSQFYVVGQSDSHAIKNLGETLVDDAQLSSQFLYFAGQSLLL
mgnify:CR=1 FL=1